MSPAHRPHQHRLPPSLLARHDLVQCPDCYVLFCSRKPLATHMAKKHRHLTANTHPTHPDTQNPQPHATTGATPARNPPPLQTQSQRT